MKHIVKRIAPPKKTYNEKKVSVDMKRLLKPYKLKVPK